ncbi:MAG: glycosyltransferase family 4 protein [Polyangiaceae bacterium]
MNVTAPPLLLYVVTEDWYFASHRLTLARAAAQAGYRVAVACRIHEHEEALRAAGCEVIPFRFARSGTDPTQEIRTYLRLAALYRERRPALVHHVAMKPVLYGSYAAWQTRVPGVVNAINGLGMLSTGQDPKTRLLRAAVVTALGRVNRRPNVRVLVQNPEDERMVAATGIAAPQQITRLPGVGVDLSRFAPSPEPSGDPLVLLSARMLFAKGVGTFVEAAQILKAEGVRARFVLAGRADPENPTSVPESQLKDWGLSGAVEWWGHCVSMHKVLQNAAIVCLPSAYGEGIPKALLEAAAAARPIVTTNTPGCREVVRPGETGLLVPPKDPVALAAALRDLLSDPEKRARFGAAGRAMAEAEFDERAVIQKTLGVYATLLRRAGIGPIPGEP